MSENEQTTSIKKLMEHLRPLLFSDSKQIQYLFQSKNIILNYIEKLICYSYNVNQECLKGQHNSKEGNCCNIHSAQSIIFDELRDKTSNYNTEKNPEEAQVFKNFYWELYQLLFINKKEITENTFIKLKEFVIILFDALKIKLSNYELNAT